MVEEENPSFPSSLSETGQGSHQNKQNKQGMELEVICKTLLTWRENNSKKQKRITEITHTKRNNIR